MPKDFRSEPMDTPEGQGIAKKAWNSYVRSVDRTVPPFIRQKLHSAVEPLASQIVEDMIGFWVMWHLYGGFAGLEEFGMNKSTIWRKVARFRRMTGEHPDVFVMPGITIDPKTYWASSTRKVGRTPQK